MSISTKLDGAFHDKLQKAHFKSQKQIGIQSVHERLQKLREITKGVDDQVPFHRVATAAWGKISESPHTNNSVSNPVRAAAEKNCFWGDPFFDTATPDRPFAIAANGAANSATPDDHNIITEFAYPNSPYGIGDTTDDEAVLVIGAGIGDVGGVEYQPHTSSNQFGHYNQAHASVAGEINLNPGAPSPFPQPNALAFGQKRINVSVNWQIGYGLPFTFQPSLLFPWASGNSDGFVGVEGNLILSLAEVNNPRNTIVVEKMFLSRWASDVEGMTSDDMGQSLYLHNRVLVPDTINASLALRSDKVSVGVGVRLVAWRAGSAPSGNQNYFAGVEFGLGNAPVLATIPEPKRIMPSSLMPAHLGPIRIFPVCYSVNEIPQVAFDDSQ